MIKIGIVDDEKIFRDRIAFLVTRILSSESMETEIRTYPDGSSFLAAGQTDGPCDILLADIQMAGLDGMELGKKIRRNNPGMHIIFITSYEEYAAESYRIEAYQYILKQDLETRLPRVIRELARKIVDQEQEYRIVGSGAEKVKILYRISFICINLKGRSM